MTAFFRFLINGVSLGSVYAIIALGYTMVYGIAKMLNFAHGDVIMVGAYIAFCGLQYWGFPPVAAILAPPNTVGSRPAAEKISATTAVVVLLPCMPEMPILTSYLFITYPRKSAREIRGIPLFPAQTYTGSSAGIATV